MNIIFEGPDCVGKGTTIELFRNEYNKVAWTNLHYTGVKMEKEFQYGYMKDLFQNMWDHFSLNNVLSDRSHISEYIFAKRYRNMNEDQLDILFQQENDYIFDCKHKTVLIMLIDTPENLLSREDGLSHSQTVADKQAELDLYVQSFNLSSLDKILVEIDGKTPDQVLEYIKIKLKEFE